MDTLYNHADVVVPPGVKINNSARAPVDSWAGTAKVNILLKDAILGTGLFIPDVPSELRVADKDECESERANRIIGDTPQGDIVSCMKGSNAVGFNYNWSTLNVIKDDDDRVIDRYRALTIGPMSSPLADPDPGLTRVQLKLCEWYNIEDNGENCGTGGADQEYQQRNGAPSERRCREKNKYNRRYGMYTVTATMVNGTVAIGDGSCVVWNDAGSTEETPRSGGGAKEIGK